MHDSYQEQVCDFLGMTDVDDLYRKSAHLATEALKKTRCGDQGEGCEHKQAAWALFGMVLPACGCRVSMTIRNGHCAGRTFARCHLPEQHRFKYSRAAENCPILKKRRRRRRR